MPETSKATNRDEHAPARQPKTLRAGKDEAPKPPARSGLISPPPKEQADVLALFLENLKATEAWYAARAERPEVDAYVVVQIATSGIAYCLELAMKGEKWTPEHATRKRG